MSRNTAITAKFIDNIAKKFEGTRTQLQNVAKLTYMEVGRRLVSYSPIGDPTLWKNPKRALYPKDSPYKPGTFINNWQVGIDEIPQQERISEQDVNGTDSLERLRRLGRWQLDHKYYFVNNLPYAKMLEFGEHSSQVPVHGMVGRVKVEFKQIVNDAVANHNKVEFE